MRSLVVYHSLSGATRNLAELAAKALGADIAEVRTSRYGPGAVGYLLAGYDSIVSRLPAIDVNPASPKSFDFVLLLAPVWTGRASTPMRSYLTLNRGSIKRAAFVLTCGGHAPPRAYEELTELSGVRPEATFTLRDKDIRRAVELPPALARFLTSVAMKQAA